VRDRFPAVDLDAYRKITSHAEADSWAGWTWCVNAERTNGAARWMGLGAE
jgi:hypothetical protein